jgi:hypothetical protein
MWKNVVQPDILLFACRIPKAINTHSKYVIFIAFPQHQWLHNHASICTLPVLLSLTPLPCKLWTVEWKEWRPYSNTNNNDVLPIQGYLTHFSGLWQMSLDQWLNNNWLGHTEETERKDCPSATSSTINLIKN